MRRPTVIKRDLGEPLAAKILRNGIRGLIRVQKPISRGPRNFIVSNSFENRVTPITSRDSPVIREFLAILRAMGPLFFINFIKGEGELKGNFYIRGNVTWNRIFSFFSSSFFNDYI